MRIVGVHGVRNYRPGVTPEQAAEALADVWTEHLRGTLSDVQGEGGPRPDVAVAYYSDTLRPPGRQGGEATLDDLDPFEQQLALAWLEQLGLPGGVAAGPRTRMLRQAVSWLATRRNLGKRPTELFVAAFFREVATYLRTAESPQRAAARDRVARAVTEHSPRVIIAHSLGSVVAYEALWAHPQLETELLITVGSPLALPHAVFPRLQPAHVGLVGRRPPGVRRWVNLADPGDLVAIPPGGVGRSFDGVDEDLESTIHAFDFHLVHHYLADVQLGNILRGLP
ncbi:hypothetical protein ACWDCO_30660 [Streptomyces albogriseolus]